MPVLTNERHELFCKGVARRRSQTQPYITDGFSCTPSRGAARQPTSCVANRKSLNARAPSWRKNWRTILLSSKPSKRSRRRRLLLPGKPTGLTMDERVALCLHNASRLSLMVGSLPAAAKPVPISLPTPKNIGGEITHWVIVNRGWARDLFDQGSVERVCMELKPASGGVPVKCPR